MQTSKHPILFSSEMVRAILDGQKTVTRRTSGLKEINEAPDAWELFRPEWNDEGMVRIGNSNRGKLLQLKSPYGKPGDILWVRETWKWEGSTKWTDAMRDGYFLYKADKDNRAVAKWKPNIHMPFAACRLFLMVKSVRIERLHDITEDDAIREGVARCGSLLFNNYTNHHAPLARAVLSFASLWESINGPDSWLQNPWVWRIEFERMEKEYALNLLNK